MALATATLACAILNTSVSLAANPAANSLDVSTILANPLTGLLLRLALGGYIIYMARSFYADPLGYFRKWMPRLDENPLIGTIVKGGALFCLWGGCFIVDTAIATQVFNLHGLPIAVLLIALSAFVTWYLLPASPPSDPHGSGAGSIRRLK